MGLFEKIKKGLLEAIAHAEGRPSPRIRIHYPINTNTQSKKNNPNLPSIKRRAVKKAVKAKAPAKLEEL